MAVTSIWPVKNRVSAVIKYACNPEKTTEEIKVDMHSLKNVIEYAADEMKTEKCEYVTGINCRKDNAVQVFNETRKRWGHGGDTRVCYHAYQSFKPGEVDANKAHQIGVELARHLYGDRFEVLVTTHVSSHCIHNHMVINAVSFADGKKFCNYKSDYQKLRQASDDICLAHGLSVLRKSPIHTPGNKNEVWMHKAGKQTRRDMIIKDIDYCLKYSSTYREFSFQMYGLGYTVDFERMTIKAKEWQRPKRLKTLGFTEEIMEERFEENARDDFFYSLEWNTHLPYKPRKAPLTSLLEELDFTVWHAKSPEKVFIAAIFYIILSLFDMAFKMADYFIQSHELRYEMKDFKQYLSDYHFMRNNNIETLADLHNDIQKTKAEISALERQRSDIDNKRRRAKTPGDIQFYKNKRKELTKQITPLRKRLKQAEKIWDKSPHLLELVRQEQLLEEKALGRYRNYDKGER